MNARKHKFGLLLVLFMDIYYSISNCSESLKAQGGTGAYFNDYLNWDKIGEFKDYIFNSPAKEVSALLLDTKVSIVVDHLSEQNIKLFRPVLLKSLIYYLHLN